jgi:hypothetical protein
MTAFESRSPEVWAVFALLENASEGFPVPRQARRPRAELARVYRAGSEGEPIIAQR